MLSLKRALIKLCPEPNFSDLPTFSTSSLICQTFVLIALIQERSREIHEGLMFSMRWIGVVILDFPFNIFLSCFLRLVKCKNYFNL